MNDIGYGVDLSSSNVRWKNGYAKNLLSMAVKHEDFLQMLKDFFCDEDLDPSSLRTEEIDAFFDDYNGDFGNSCMEGLLADVINLEKFGGEDIFAFEDMCLYVPARIPADDAERLKRPTILEIQAILAQYLNPLLEEPVTLQYLAINL